MLPAMKNRSIQCASDLLTPREAARLTGLTPFGLARMADRGQLTTIKPGGTHRRYLRSEVEALARPVTTGGTR